MPKSEFAADPKNVAAHRQLIAKPELRYAVSVSLLEYARRQSNKETPDLGSCAACNLRLAGAQEFVDLFYNLAETIVTAPPIDSLNLPVNVRQMPSPKKNN
jgi:hypothetical protein